MICGIFATGYLQFGYAYPYCQSWRSSKHHTGGSCGPVAPSTVHSIWWNMRMIFVGENAHMNTPVTCELRHLSGCNMGRFPVCFWSCAIYGSGKHNQTAHTPVAKTPQIQPCSPNTKYVFAVLRGKKMAQYGSSAHAMLMRVAPCMLGPRGAKVHGATSVFGAWYFHPGVKKYNGDNGIVERRGG